MQAAITETFSIRYPSLYEQIETPWDSISLDHIQDGNYLSGIFIGIQELSFYDKFKGDTLPDRFQESCLHQRGAVEVIADKTLPVAGLNASIRTVQSPDWGYFYYFGLIPVNEEIGYIITADCDTASQGFYEPLFDEIWQSLAYFGDPAAALKKQRKELSGDKQEAPASDIKSILPFTVPANGEGYWQIGDHAFTIIDDIQCYISDHLFVKIEAKAPGNIDPAQSDIINNEKVYLQFYFKGIYNGGIPSGKFFFEQERENTGLTFIWKSGFQYSQQLTAEVTLEAGWLGINGYFNQYPLKLAVKLPVADLAWEKYHFLSIAEVSTAPPAIVHQLWLTNPDPGLLQDVLPPFTRLQVLSIDYRDSLQAAGFKEIPHSVKYLIALKALFLTGVKGLDTLPQWLGDLKNLETIRLSDSKVKEIHPAIFQLPSLKKLYLYGNQLEFIPPVPGENLETLVLTNNQLATVPASVTQLQYLNIERNPLQHLPTGVENIPTLELELEKKLALLDYTYKGGDGQGTVPYKDTRFFAKNDPQLLQLLDEQITAAALEPYKEGLIRRTRHAVALETTTEDVYSEKGNHRFGGLPDLPPGISFPDDLLFIAQINCRAIAHLQDYLPRTGMLYFFINDLEEIAPSVLYYDGDSSNLQSAKDLTSNGDVYTPFMAETGKYPSTPILYHAGQLYPELAGLEEMYEKVEHLESGLKAHAAGPRHSINSYVFMQHGTPEMAAADKKRGRPEEWMVLLRVSSDNKPGFQFWDAGEIYFVIHKSDLEKKDFSNVYCGLESS